jgi:flagellar hook-length control protein FliK
MIQTLLAAAATQARPPAETRAAGTTAAPRATVASTALPTTLATTAAVLPASGTAPSAAPESPEPASLADPKKPLTGLPGTATKAEHGETPTAGLSATLSAALSAAVGAAGIEPGTQPADAAASMLQAAAATRETTASPVPPTAASAPAAPAQSPTLDVAQLPQQLGERLRWLIDGSVQEARLSLHPQELGNIDVRIRVEDGSAKVWFAAEHPAARAALDAALPQLRERFAGDGLNLQSSAVSTQGRGWDSQGQSQSSSRFSGGTAPAIDDSAETTVDSPAASSRSAVHEGLIDRYA